MGHIEKMPRNVRLLRDSCFHELKHVLTLKFDGVT
jgi:hypothetical protein